MLKTDYEIVKIVENHYCIYTKAKPAVKAHIRKKFETEAEAGSWLDCLITAYNGRLADYSTLNESFKWDMDKQLGLLDWQGDISSDILVKFKEKFK